MLATASRLLYNSLRSYCPTSVQLDIQRLASSRPRNDPYALGGLVSDSLQGDPDLTATAIVECLEPASKQALLRALVPAAAPRVKDLEDDYVRAVLCTQKSFFFYPVYVTLARSLRPPPPQSWYSGRRSTACSARQIFGMVTVCWTGKTSLVLQLQYRFRYSCLT